MTETEDLPVVGFSQNDRSGTGKIVTDYDAFGGVQSVTDADGYTTNYRYDYGGLGTGVLIKTVQGLDTAQSQTITTSSVPDLLGRTVQTTDGNLNVTTIQYCDGLLQSSVTTTPEVAPAGQTTAPTQTVLTDAGQGTVTTTTTATSGSMEKVSMAWLDYAGRTLKTQRYDGMGDTYTTLDAYDDSGNLYWTQDAVGTITETLFDGLGRATLVAVGTTDSNLTYVESEQYDNNQVGDGDLTRTNQYTSLRYGGYTGRDTTSYYDWRDRLVAQDDGILLTYNSLNNTLAQDNGLQITYNTLDNQGEVTQSDVYDATLPNTGIVIANGVPQPPGNANALRAQTSTAYDNRGRAYETDVYSVDPNNGTVGGSLETDIYHDGRGDVVATAAPGGLVTTTAYDGARRVTLQQSGNAGAVAGTIGTVVQSTATQYDNDSNPIFATTSQLNPDGTTMRNTYVGNWYDPDNRLLITVNYGTNGGTAISQRPQYVTSVPGLWTSYQYDAGGFLCQTTDPAALQTTYFNDWLGRAWKVVVNSGIGTSVATQGNEVTLYSYDGLNRQILVTVENVTPVLIPGHATTWVAEPASCTQYVYKATTGGNGVKGYAAFHGWIYSNDLLSEIVYPDGTTQWCFYDDLGEVISQINRDGSVHEYQYDGLGRQTRDTVTPMNFDIDCTVAALGDTYNALGN